MVTKCKKSEVAKTHEAGTCENWYQAPTIVAVPSPLLYIFEHQMPHAVDFPQVPRVVCGHIEAC